MIAALDQAFSAQLNPDVIRAALGHYRLDLDGIHGPAHWIRVLENGLKLAESTGADREVIALFALTHDLGRRNDGRDLEHGCRSAEIARGLRSSHLELSDARFGLLYQACAEHTLGFTEGDVTVQTCWDADRLDLVRLGYSIDPDQMCTGAGRDPDMIRWSWQKVWGSCS